MSLVKSTSFSPTLPLPGDTPGERLRWARLKKNLSIVALSRKSDVSEGTISGIENHNESGSIITIRLLAAILEQPIWFLGCFEKLPSIIIADKIKKTRLYHGLTKKEFANRIGVNEKTVRLWEADLCKLTAQSLQKVEPYLHILTIQQKKYVSFKPHSDYS